MLQVAQPFGLLAMTALAVPILIHLRRRPSRVVRVGSLEALRMFRRPRRWLHLHDPLLLALRCAVLIALALCLAGLQWNPRTPPPVRWCLLVPGTELAGTNLVAWNAHRRDGFETRWLLTGFPRIDDANPAASALPRPTLDLWSLLREADLRLPADSRVIVFGPTWASQFQGTRPTLRNVEVRWLPVQSRPPAHPPAPLVRVGIVASPDRSIDAHYLQAALRAIDVPIVTNEEPTWVFQLGTAALPTKWADAISRGTRLVLDAPETEPARQVSREFEAGSRSASLHQRVNARRGVPLFRDSWGEPWLTEQRNASDSGTVVTWHFAFRFHPDWTDWPLGSAFPAWWRGQLHPDSPDTSEIAPEQAAPRFVSNRENAPTPAAYHAAAIDLRAGCWAVGALLFLAERALGLSRRRQSAPS